MTYQEYLHGKRYMRLGNTYELTVNDQGYLYVTRLGSPLGYHVDDIYPFVHQLNHRQVPWIDEFQELFPELFL